VSLIYSLTQSKTAIVGTNKSTSTYNAVTDTYTEITIPEYVTKDSVSYKVTEIGQRAFYSYSSLKKINFPTSLVQINAQAFDLCKIEGELDFKNSISFFGKLAFASNALTKVKINQNVKVISSGAFAYSSGGISLIVDQSNPYFMNDNQNVLYDKSKTRLIQISTILTSYTIPSSVREIDYAAFARASIREIIIPQNVKEIYFHAFFYANLSKVIIRGNPILNSLAFSSCVNLKSIYYCGTKKVDIEVFTNDCTPTIYVCYGYNGQKFSNRDVNISDQCVSLPLASPCVGKDRKIPKLSISFLVLLL